MNEKLSIEEILKFLLVSGDSARMDVVAELISLWNSKELPLKNGDRQRNLRPELLKRLVSLVMTDDERAAYFGLPEGCRMRENAKIISPENFECGKHVWVGEGAVLDASGGLSIGSHTSIGLNVFVWSHTSYLTNLTMNNVSSSDLIQRKKTTIGSGCFVAGPSVIFHGITIGDRCMVMPMSVVNKDVPSNSMIGGNPARVIKAIDDEFIAQRIEELRKPGVNSV